MLILTIEINFKNKEVITLYSESRSVKVRHSTMIARMSNRFDHWSLEPRKVRSEYDFIWEFTSGSVILCASDFLNLVGTDEEEALKIMLSNNSDVSKSELIEYITPEVKSFYALLALTELESVTLKLRE